jgi:hypothetical protein
MEVWVPWLEIAAPILLAISLTWLGFRFLSGRVRRIVFPVASIAICCVTAGLSLFLLTAQGCEENRPLIGSPDGRHVARMMIWGSVPSGTSLRIIERRSWSPHWQVVSEAGTIGTLLDPIEPRLAWTDNRHLVIDYPVPGEGSGSDCINKKVGDILIVCKTH